MDRRVSPAGFLAMTKERNSGSPPKQPPKLAFLRFDLFAVAL